MRRVHEDSELRITEYTVICITIYTYMRSERCMCKGISIAVVTCAQLHIEQIALTPIGICIGTMLGDIEHNSCCNIIEMYFAQSTGIDGFEWFLMKNHHLRTSIITADGE